jgi:RNA polymerase sigma factor (TIGR02999 family)
MSPSPAPDLTTLLRAWTSGDEEAFQKLSDTVHAELHRLARRYMANEKAGHTLQPTALINEAWLRLIDWQNVSWQNRAHFFGVSAQMMRRILVDHVRRRPHLQGGAAPKRVSVENALEISPRQDCDLIAVDEALQSLAKLDPRKAQIVELRFFGGLDENEVAEVLQVSSKTVQREWIKSKAWLYHELNKTGDS